MSCLASSIAVPGSAQDEAAEVEAEDVAARFGARSSVLDISLSPSGTKVAWVAAGPEHSEVLNVVDLAGPGSVKQIAKNTEVTSDLSWCRWATDERLVCQVDGMGKAPDGTLIGFDRMFAIDYDGTEIESLSERRSLRAFGFNQSGGSVVAFDVAGEDGRILLTKTYLKENSTGTRLANEKEGLGVDQIDVNTGRRRVEEQPDDGAMRYIADELGEVRIKARAKYDLNGMLTGDYYYYFRAPDSRHWQELADISLDGKPVEGFLPVAVDAARNSAFGFTSVGGFTALAEVPLSNPRAGKVVFARDDVDVDGLIRIGRQRRVVGASYATEKRSVAYFDDELATLARALGRRCRISRSSISPALALTKASCW
ncbi:hypothetical protein [Erythrobacter rubeus]|uniref:hypothetical protein n=1 Tax=Erythrobacter rubeus TaxID=2760803 RepID=UPI001F3410F3|nr:hypothetical protein [Erythrobacter rubeus]